MGNPINPAANSASFAGIGTVAAFGNLSVSPAQASPGDTVTIAFHVSEAFQAEPEVTVNGHAAVLAYGKAEGYVFEYEVQESDAPGLAVIMISGADLAGNVGA